MSEIIKEEEKDPRDAQIAALLEQNAKLMEMLMGKQSVKTASSHDDVTLVYLDDALGYIGANGVELNVSRFGEQFVVSRSQFDAIFGKYHSWFDRGILAVSDEDTVVAAQKGIKTVGEYALDSKELAKIGSMTSTQIENLWNKVSTEAHRHAIVLYFKRKYLENQEPGYRDRGRVDTLNRLTNGGFKREAQECGGDFRS